MQPRFLLPLSTLIVSGICRAETELSPGIPSSTFFQAFIGLAIIVILLAGTAWIARKMSGGKGFGQGGLRVIGGVALGPRERLVLVEVGDSWLVVGIVPGQIRTLHTLPKGELPTPASGQQGQVFAHWLKQMMEKRGNAS